MDKLVTGITPFLVPTGLIIGLLATLLAIGSGRWYPDLPGQLRSESAIALALVAGVFVFAGKRPAG